MRAKIDNNLAELPRGGYGFDELYDMADLLYTSSEGESLSVREKSFQCWEVSVGEEVVGEVGNMLGDPCFMTNGARLSRFALNTIAVTVEREQIKRNEMRKFV